MTGEQSLSSWMCLFPAVRKLHASLSTCQIILIFLHTYAVYEEHFWMAVKN